jgi:hypothetical protein
MAEFDNELSGALFTNAKKTTDNHPDYNGNCTIDGVEYWISGWIKKPKAGGKNFLSLAFKVKEPMQPPKQASRPQVPLTSISDDDIPF